jgi:hypothetical protein
MPNLNIPILNPSLKPPPSSWGTIFEEDQEPQDGFYEAQLYENDRLQPDITRTFRIKVGIRATGKALIKHRITYAEGSQGEETVEIGIP